MKSEFFPFVIFVIFYFVLILRVLLLLRTKYDECVERGSIFYVAKSKDEYYSFIIHCSR